MNGVAYRLPIKESIQTAWAKVHGAKASFWAAIVIVVVVTLVFAMIDNYLQHRYSQIEPFFYFVSQLIVYLFQLGLMYLGILRAQGMPIHYGLVFRGYEKSILLKAIGLYILQFLIVLVPIILMVVAVLFSSTDSTVNVVNTATAGATVTVTDSNSAISGMGIFLGILFVIGFIAIVYLTVRMSLSLAFVVDKMAGPWQAIKLAFEASRSNIWRLIAIYFLQMIIILVSIIPLGIGLIWSLPFAFILYGTIYKNLSLNNLRSAHP